MKRPLILLTLLPAVLVLTLLGGLAGASNYCNARYGYCVNIPKSLFPQGESDNGDGEVFLSRDARVSLTVWASHTLAGVPGASFDTRFREDARGWPVGNGRSARVVTYTLHRPTFYVVSGLENGKIFYQRTLNNPRSGTYATYLLTYPDDHAAGTFIKSLNVSFHF